MTPASMSPVPEGALRVLFVPNWAVYEGNESIRQRPDRYQRSAPYWFFEHFSAPVDVDVLDIRQGPTWRVEEKLLHFYLGQGLRAAFRAKHYDCVVFHGAQSCVVELALARLRVADIPLAVVIDVGTLNGGRPQKRLSFGLTRFALNRCDAIVWHASSSREVVAEHAPELIGKGHFIPFGVELNEFAEFEAKDGDYAVCVGYAQREWGLLGKAWEGLDAPLTLVGAPADAVPSVPGVRALPRLDFDAYCRMVAGARVVVLPITDGNASWGQMTLLQAMALGKPVVVTDVGPVRDYLGEHCRVVPDGDPAALRQAVRSLWDDAAERQRLSALARQAVVERFGEATMARAIERLIRSAVEGVNR